MHAPLAIHERRAVTLVDETGERTITTFGSRLEPVGDDERLPWDVLEGMDAVYFTAGDLGALRAARRARVLVASPRAVDALGQGVALDALVLSGDDAVERRQAARAQDETELVVFTEGERGGAYRTRVGNRGDGRRPRRRRPARTPTAAATPSRRVSPTGWAPASRCRPRWRWRPAAARCASPAAGPISDS